MEETGLCPDGGIVLVRNEMEEGEGTAIIS
jgi:hypothetical protein